jgi:hypothetical protein
MKKEKSLQKLTKIDKKIQSLFALEKITPNDLECLNKTERDKFLDVLTQKFNTFKGKNRDNLYDQVEAITSDNTRNQLWEYNHNQITWAISNLIQDYGRMPSKTEIALKTELSRQTVHKHLNEYKEHPLYLGQIEQFRFMTSKVLARVFSFAVNGDIGAAKLFFNIVGVANNSQTLNQTLIQNQNNYIQINGTVLSQEAIKHLNPEQLNSIEQILKTALPAEIIEATQ